MIFFKNRLHRLKEREMATFSQDKATLMKAVERHDMLPFYEYLCESFEWKKDESIASKLKTKIDAQLEQFEKVRHHHFKFQKNLFHDGNPSKR